MYHNRYSNDERGKFIMAWQDVSEQQLRFSINDFTYPYRYDTATLNTGWLIGATYVTAELNLANTYTIDLLQQIITPDPSIQGSEPTSVVDQWMMNLTTMRTSIMILTNDLKLAAKNAYLIRDVHTTADLREMYKANKMILDEMNTLYENAKMQYQCGVNPQLAAVLTPINILCGGYRYPTYGFDARDRMLY